MISTLDLSNMYIYLFILVINLYICFEIFSYYVLKFQINK